jgi:hypothetical protein
MPVSGSTTWELDRNQLIQTAMRKLGALGEGHTPTVEEYTNGVIALNGIMAAFQTLGMPLWERRVVTVPLTASTESYNIGVGQTINVPFLLKLHHAYLVNSSTGQRLEMEVKSYFDWNQVRNTGSTTAYPVFVSYTPYINFGVLNVWPIPNATAATNYDIELVGQGPFDDFTTTTTHTLDFPKEWHNAIIYELAVTLAPEFGASQAEKDDLRKDAKKWLDYAKDFGTDETSIFFQIERTQ